MGKSTVDIYDKYKKDRFITIPYEEYLELHEANNYTRNLRLRTPTEVVAAIDGGHTPLKAWRLHRRMTQIELAKAADIQRTIIVRIETRTNMPRWSTLIKLADALMINPDQLG
jgi:DNA-binding XRE family transcriptional regulator